ncbi:GntR family transcriptional regulator [Nocardioides sp. CFH 31398]|uniref:GntR family transcriptional regulator n=1 Tax=Nocardioides sp. CFH 31398 TaxID=2919579 RepID=UPI001F0640AD|nr:GntR family transcriptional regulator [Nocardioides sp. CFH 31398]MCH1867823.1 GntR family transcriptional regulator [Nocardioides sp. CFH 31398]
MGETGDAVAVGGELLSATIKRVILDRIRAGHYEPGERIVELRLAKELGTSQSPVREALRDLAGIGVVTVHSRRGARVRQPTSKDLADVSLVRSEIDAMAAQLATPLMHDEAVEQLATACTEMAESLAEHDYVRMTQADARFHRIIALQSDNSAVLRVFDQLEPFARTFITLTMPNTDVGAVVGEHEQILSAIREGDATLAAQRARIHQLNVSALFRRHYPDPPAAD